MLIPMVKSIYLQKCKDRFESSYIYFGNSLVSSIRFIGIRSILIYNRELPLSQNICFSNEICKYDFPIILDFLNTWVHFVSGYHLKSSSATLCQFYNWIFSSTFTYCAWLVVTVAIERIIVVWFPFKAKTLCTVKKSIIVVCSIAVACALYNSNNFLIWELNDKRNGRCDMNPEYEYFYRYVYSWISNVAYCYVPVILLIIVNTLISVGLSKANKARQRLTGEEMSESKKVTVTVITIWVKLIGSTRVYTGAT